MNSRFLLPLLTCAAIASLSACSGNENNSFDDDGSAGEAGDTGSGGSGGTRASGGSGGKSSGSGGTGDSAGAGGSDESGGAGGGSGGEANETECSPNAKRCDVRTPQTCDADGFWQSADQCEFACVDGACTGVCVPGDSKCSSETEVEVCTAVGAWDPATCTQFCSESTEACACTQGYTVNGNDCTPIDFCSAPNGGCSPNATCTQEELTPSCECKEGFFGDGFSCSPAPTQQTNEGFEEYWTLSARGWTFENHSAPLGTTSWMNPPVYFDAYDGESEDFLAALYSSTLDHGTISNWAAAPPIIFGVNSSVSFYTRSLGTTNGYADRAEIRLCKTLVCAMPTDAVGVGDYTTLLETINPNLVTTNDGYPTDWTQYEYTNADGLPYSGEGRVAIRYFVTDSGGAGANGDMIGIDRFVASAGAPAYRVSGSVSGLTGEVELWLNRNVSLTVSANGSFGFTPLLDTNTPYSVTVLTQPAGQICVVTNGHGTVASADVTNISVSCAAP